jgi:phosphoglycerate dehydrogenase-like enzyme
MDHALRNSDWRPRYEPNRTLLLQGRTALVLGYGAVGRAVGRLCCGLGMRVLFTRKRIANGGAPVTEDCVHAPGELRELLPRADALIVCLPHTPDTDGLIGVGELALMPSDAIVVNVGRGGIVDEAALYHALREGRLYGAGLDVWYNYPVEVSDRANTPPSDYPFHELDNVVMSPHRAGGSASSESRRMAGLAGLLNAAARGEPLPNRVDLEAGY